MVRRYCLLILTGVCCLAQSEPKKENPFDKIPWIKGPAEGLLGSQAEIAVPEGFLFAGRDGTRTFLEMTENIPNGGEYGMIAPEGLDWFAIFTFHDSGYIKDDEKSQLDGDALLKTLREGQESDNEARKRKGWETIEIVGWKRAPYFNDATKNLEWATEARSDKGLSSVNHNTRVLGRRGYMSVVLVGSPKTYETELASFRKTMEKFHYTSENQYAAFRDGDKIAEYGLTGLIVGGAAAVATKTGLLKSMWKFIVLAVAGLGGFVKKLFTRSKPDEEVSEAE